MKHPDLSKVDANVYQCERTNYRYLSSTVSRKMFGQTLTIFLLHFIVFLLDTDKNITKTNYHLTQAVRRAESIVKGKI